MDLIYRNPLEIVTAIQVFNSQRQVLNDRLNHNQIKIWL